MLAELRSLLLPAAPGLALVSKGRVPAVGRSTAICSRRAGAEGRSRRFGWKSAHLFLGGSEVDSHLQPKGTKLTSPERRQVSHPSPACVLLLSNSEAQPGRALPGKAQVCTMTSVCVREGGPKVELTLRVLSYQALEVISSKEKPFYCHRL